MADPSLDRGEIQRRAARGAVWTLLHTVVSMPVAWLANVVLARILGVADYGQLALLTTVMLLVGVVVASGVDQAMVQLGARAHSAGRFEETRDLLSRVQGFRLLVLAPIVSCAAWRWTDVHWVFLVCALVFGVWMPAAFSGAAVSLTLENRTDVDARIQLVTSLLQQAIVVGVALLFATPDAVWTTRVAIAGFTTLAALPFIRADYRRAVLRPKSPFGLPRSFWRYAVPVGLAAILSAVATERSELFFLNAFSTPVEMGLFAVAFGLANHLLAPAQALINPLVPAITGLHEVDRGALGRALERVLRVSAVSAGGILAALGAPLALAVPFIYGADYAAASTLMLALLISAALILVTFPMQAFLQARLRGGSILTLNVGTVVANVAVAAALVGPLGAWGAALAKASVGVTRLAYFLLAERSSFPLAPRQMIRELTPLAHGAAASVAGLALGVRVGSGLPGILAAAVLSAAVFLGCLRWSGRGLTRPDGDALVGAVPARLRGVTSRGLVLLTRTGAERP